jgi:hypothetical protein
MTPSKHCRSARACVSSPAQVLAAPRLCGLCLRGAHRARTGCRSINAAPIGEIAFRRLVTPAFPSRGPDAGTIGHVRPSRSQDMDRSTVEVHFATTELDKGLRSLDFH